MKKNKGLIFSLIAMALVAGAFGYTVSKINPAYAINNEITEDNEDFYMYIDDGIAVPPGGVGYFYLKLDLSKWSAVNLKFKSTTSSEVFSTFVKDLGMEKPYFVIPDPVSTGRYELKEIVLYTNGANGYGWGAGPVYVTNRDEATEYHPFIDTRDRKYITVTERQVINNTSDPLDGIKLNNITLRDSAITYTENAYIKLSYSGNVDYAMISFRGGQEGAGFTSKIEDLNSNPHFSVPRTTFPGSYKMARVELCRIVNGAHYCNSFDTNSDGASLQEQLLKVFSNETDIKLVAVNLNTYEALPGDKVMIDVNAINKSISKALLIFFDKENNNSFSAYVKNLNGHPYFMLPSTTKPGNYRLQTVMLTDPEGNTQVTEVPEFDGKSYKDENGVFYETIELTVKEDKIDDKNKLLFNNEDFNDLLSMKIESMSDTAVITVICDNGPLVKSTLFKLIADTRRTLILQYGDSEWVFNGTDIVEAKPIDVGMLINSVKNSDFGKSNISDKISSTDATVLSFANNGTLPGKALIRLNSTELDAKIGKNDIYVYYYNSEDDSLYKVAFEVQKIEGYYEFYINHNSDYIITTKKLDNSVVAGDDAVLNVNTTANNATNNNNHFNISFDNQTMIIIVAVLLIAVIIIIACIVAFRSKKNK